MLLRVRVTELAQLVLPTALAVIVNAIVDALRPLGVTELTMPATPFRVWSAIQAARGA